ncbi:MAG: hypothetical protein HRS50_01830, partial [Mycoplasmataceae bacterium]|nr:hypothetical protein [Mycoplasmataceae bacterium]
IIKEYPGIILEGRYQNIMNIVQLKETHPKKEIKLTNYQLNNNQTISIGDYAKFNIINQLNKIGYQFTFSNLVKLHRGKYSKHNNFVTHPINIGKENRYDIIISGLGIITFKSIGQKLEIELPKGVKFNLIKSLYQ